MPADPQAVAAVLEPVVTAAAYDLEGLDVRPAGRRSRLVVTVDSDSLDSDGLAALSQDISRALDDSDIMGDIPYTLEVTSRGVDAPLTAPRHWRRNRDRLVQVQMRDDAQVTGRIGTCAEDHVLIDGNPVAFDDIARAVVVVEFAPRKDS